MPAASAENEAVLRDRPLATKPLPMRAERPTEEYVGAHKAMLMIERKPARDDLASTSGTTHWSFNNFLDLASGSVGSFTR